MSSLTSFAAAADCLECPSSKRTVLHGRFTGGLPRDAGGSQSLQPRHPEMPPWPRKSSTAARIT
jgi:hypothetical protein